MAEAQSTSLQPFFREIAPLPAKMRLDRILARKDTMRVVRSMPVTDLYATVRDVGVEDSLEILELMSPAQVQGFLDLDGWRRDRIDPVAIGKWLRAFFAANPERATGQLRGLDLELLTLLFKVHCTVYDLSQDEQPAHEVGRHTVTPDNRYLIVYGGVAADDETQATLQQAVERLLARDMMFVLRLCEAVRWELASQLEEDALRWRNGRMADLGFLPTHEAAAIFAYLDPEKPLPQSSAPAVPPPSVDDATSTDLTTSPLLPWTTLTAGDNVLSRALQGISDAAVRDRVAHELMLVANRVHAADGADLGDADALKETARQVALTAGTGLAFAVKGDERRLSEALASTSIHLVFRLGHSLSLKLGHEVRARIKTKGSGLDGRGLLRLDSPLREVVAGFLRPRPTLFAGLIDEKRVDYRPVASLGELATAAAALTEAAFRAALLHRLGATDAVFVDIDDAVLPTHAAVLGSLVAQLLLGETATVRPLSDEEVEDVKRRVARGWSADDEERVLCGLDTRVRPLAPLPGAVSGDDVVARTRAYARPVLAAISAELRAVRDVRPEGRYLSSLWVR